MTAESMTLIGMNMRGVLVAEPCSDIENAVDAYIASTLQPVWLPEKLENAQGETVMTGLELHAMAMERMSGGDIAEKVREATEKCRSKAL